MIGPKLRSTKLWAAILLSITGGALYLLGSLSGREWWYALLGIWGVYGPLNVISKFFPAGRDR